MLTDRRTEIHEESNSSCSQLCGVHDAFDITLPPLPQTVSTRCHKNIFCCTKLFPQYMQETIFLSESFRCVPNFEIVWTISVLVNN